MTVETATYVSDLQPSFPPATDPRAQGDDHIRLIKQVLQNTFGNTTRQFQIPGALSKTSNYSVAKADGESTVYVSTSGGAVTLTLPTLVAADAGWKIHFIKTSSDANPMFIAPSAGTINSGGIAGLSKARRAIPGVRISAIWDGTAWFATRAHATPIGATIEYNLATLPPGFEWPNGQTLSSAANYPEYNSAAGGLVTPDHRGRFSASKDDMGGTPAGRITTAGGGVDGVTLGAVGGVQSITLAANQIPSLTSSGANNISVNYGGQVPVGSFAGIQCSPTGGNNVPNGTWSTQTSSSVTSNNISVAYTNAAQVTVKNLPTTIVVNKILVVE